MSVDAPTAAALVAHAGRWSAPHAFADAGLVGATCTAAVALLLLLAPRIGLVDDARDAPDRKRHRRPVPLVGGLALALALVAWVVVRGAEVHDLDASAVAPRGAEVLGGPVAFGVSFTARAVLVSLFLAFTTGFVDDLAPRGLSPLAKLVGQSIAGAALARGLSISGVEASIAVQIACAFAAVVAQNAANTFDNADGALCGVAAAGLVAVTPFAAALLAFLPWNLLRRSGSDTPRAWLGDAGSHGLGILLLATPVAWAALVLPLVDLARVVVARLRAGHPIWRGDRRHLAHALSDRGHGPVAIAALLVLMAAPAVVLAAWLAPVITP